MISYNFIVVISLLSFLVSWVVDLPMFRLFRSPVFSVFFQSSSFQCFTVTSLYTFLVIFRNPQELKQNKNGSQHELYFPDRGRDRNLRTYMTVLRYTIYFIVS